MDNRIFIASAREHQEHLAAPIAQELAGARFTPIRWWKHFQNGDVTLEALRRTARNCEGAVLICVGSDITWYRDQQCRVPRDNLLLELGLFLDALGPSRVVVVTDADTTLPSDIAGYTHILASGDVPSLCERIVEYFRHTFPETARHLKHTPDTIKIEADPHLAAYLSRRPLPHDWHQRALYLGPEAAVAWLNLTNDPTYTNATKGRRQDTKLYRWHLNIPYARLSPWARAMPGSTTIFP